MVDIFSRRLHKKVLSEFSLQLLLNDPELNFSTFILLYHENICDENIGIHLRF